MRKKFWEFVGPCPYEALIKPIKSGSLTKKSFSTGKNEYSF